MRVPAGGFVEGFVVVVATRVPLTRSPPFLSCGPVRSPAGPGFVEAPLRGPCATVPGFLVAPGPGEIVVRRGSLVLGVCVPGWVLPALAGPVRASGLEAIPPPG